MCGFCGFTGKLRDEYTKLNLSSENNSPTEQTTGNPKGILDRMMEKIKHRGPDDSGKYIDGNIALGFRRLSIIGLTDKCQPFLNEDGRYVLAFNGEIYNYKTLKEELISRGHDFKTMTDSEVILHLYEDFKENMLDKLRGMFTFAIWDKVEQTLFIARDFFGVKPFYYHLTPDGHIIFASEIKSMLEYPDFRKEVNLTALESYLSFQYSVMPETFFKGIYRLLPGHYGIYNMKTGKLQTYRYFEPVFTEDKTLSLDEKTEMIDNVMQNSIKAHMISDTEVGSFLSSGVDSSYVAACFKGNKTFTVAFDYEKYNEAEHAKRLSEYIGIKNICKMITKEEYWNVLPEIQYHMDEPLADASCVGLYFVSKLAAEHVKVVLSGEGADELFGGYAIYNEPFGLKTLSRLPLFLRRFLGFLASLIPFDIKGRSYFIRGSKRVEERFIGNAYIFSGKERRKILKHHSGAPDPDKFVSRFYEKVKDKDDVTKMQYIDIHTWLAGDILLKADRMSMAHSLELRVPFLDREVFKVASMLSVKDKVDGKRTKIALRKAAGKHLPEETANRKKLGFPTPIRIWLREELYYTTVKKAFQSDNAKAFFRSEELVKMLDTHKKGKKDLSRKIWTVYMFLVWYDVYFRD